MLGSLMEQEIREQPGLLSWNQPVYAKDLRLFLAGIRPEMILLVARGSSDHAALYARYLIEVHLRIPVSLAAPSVLTRYRRHVRYRNCLAIGISQSGAAPDVAEVLASLVEQRQVALAITNIADSKVAGAANFELPLAAGPEISVAATKTFTTSLLALYEVVRALGGDVPDPVALLPDDLWCESSRVTAEKHAPALLKHSPIFSLGRGFGFATASEAALKLMECAIVPAKAYSTADFEHGPKALAGLESGLLLFDEVGESLAAQGASCFMCPQAPAHVPIELHPIWQTFYAQWLALACARIRGYDPDKPQFIQKVTRTT